ncbi:FAD-dependent oxidoreductase [Kribbella catacumbae]|uniref:FAD-dependent oxidoreductase n=1 Tax=Kribbella catacumbae TaxID=460086 RepID=UPI000361168A|nr:FAD-dependent oxidoreductase [Kribbella catacumbae]
MRVVVLGAGISGLSTATLLRQRGDDVVLVSAHATEATTSHLAAAVWFPTSAGPADKVASWGSTTYDVLAAEAERGVPGVVMRESLVVYREEPPPQPWAAAVGDIRPAKADELPAGYSHGLRFAVPLVEMPTYLPWLYRQYVDGGGHQVVRRIDALHDLLDLAPDVIVNCGGLAAGKLVGDTSTYPIRGQIVRVVNPGLSMSMRDETHPAGRAYVHPRTNDCILGGTLDAGVWDTTVDDETTLSIISRCSDLVPALAGTAVIEALVGLRPGRPEVRLERDDELLPGVPVVHNYGHGGSGITLGWGCAADAVRACG